MKILVGLSGGVDSSVAALILKEQGHEVIGAKMTIQSSGVPKAKGRGNSCYGSDEKEGIEVARKAAKQIDIPFHVFDCSKIHEKIVIENFKAEYLGGRTPNPCVLCNALVKFGALPQIARESGLKFDKFATGHYARVEVLDTAFGFSRRLAVPGVARTVPPTAIHTAHAEKTTPAAYALKRGLDPKKDQSYFLYRLTQEQLANILMPLGGYTKEQIREIAHEHGLVTADKSDSQDFYSGDYNDLLEIEPKIGNIVDETGKILGTHKGIWNFTVGQRKGLPGGAAEPLYVLELRECTNEVVVGFEHSAFKSGLVATNPSWILKPEFPAKVSAKIRSTQTPVDITLHEKAGELIIEFVEPQKSVTPGQSVVLYDRELVLGGGIIVEGR